MSHHVRLYNRKQNHSIYTKAPFHNKQQLSFSKEGDFEGFLDASLDQLAQILLEIFCIKLQLVHLLFSVLFSDDILPLI